MEIWAFILVSMGIIIIPGPNVLVVISTSLAYGRARGLQTVAGTSAAMLVQLFIAALGTAWFVSALASGFLWLKWLGVSYLFYLGIRHLLAIGQHQREQQSVFSSFQRGFLVSLTNPKTILFFSAFLPQFTSPAEAYLPQIALLSFIFWGLAVILDSVYALLAHRLSSLMRSHDLAKVQHGLSAVLYIGAGSALAATKNV
tara:strand:+ start:3248 stop:3847 length:600 start_codon:yes stop_codon:yes gene_type:complete